MSVVNLLSELSTIGVTTPWTALLAARNFLLTVWDPTRSDIAHGINALIQGALANAPSDQVDEMRRTHPALAELYAERYDPDLDPNDLAALPDGTLGREYLRFIRTNQIDPLGTLVAMGRPKNALQYVFRRAYKLHDIMHVVLGCDATVLGEVRIVSWSIGQSSHGFVGRAPALALAVLFLHLAIRKPQDMKEAITLSRPWMDLGERSVPHAGVRFEDYLDRPVEDVRAMVCPPAIDALLAERAAA